VSVITTFILLLWAYSNHFNNPFHFDDDHTIVSNSSIRNIKNIPLFFKDAHTTSSLPANQAYRPMLTTLNAIDYYIGGAPDPVPCSFHLSIFISYFVLGVLLFFFFLSIFNSTQISSWNKYLSLFATSFYCLHTANAETINYIIARSDSFSTLMVVLSFIIYIYRPAWRSKYIYLIPFTIGMLVKEPAVMFGPLLFVYTILFEQESSLTHIFKRGQRHKLIKALSVALPAVLIGLVYFYFSRIMTPPSWFPGGGKWYYYLITQPFVIVHYINNFFLPFNLSADTDWELIWTIFDDRVIAGVLIVGSLIMLGLVLSKYKSTRPITFGLLWFFISLIPSSSIFSLAEVLNDHRPFFGYIGLTMATVWGGVLLCRQFAPWLGSSFLTKSIMLLFATAILCGHAYGTHCRNKVWSSEENLWYDVSIKSPKNARGLMNYGNVQMAKGNFTAAQEYYERALKFRPNYSYLFINMGVLNSAMGNASEAELNFNKAIQLNPNVPEAYYHFANFLKKQGRINHAIETIRKGLMLSPDHVANQKLYDELIAMNLTTLDEMEEMEKKVSDSPSPETYLNLSLAYYKQNEFEKCIEAANNALNLKPDYAEAYNNICSAYNRLGKYNEAEKACNKALQIKPDYELAKNNLQDVLSRKTKEEKMLGLVKSEPSADNYINLSLFYYNNGNFFKCIEAANNALKQKSKMDIAYNNICSAYNSLKMWDKAIDAGEKGIAINPANRLLKNNLAVSKQGKKLHNN
ncbi:MAG: tetratricopeptide repeat protein, partial [Bacteroidia bacterium]|nr:tetratricopeptide repeat protein [Bacteroidia bacterium]